MQTIPEILTEHQAFKKFEAETQNELTTMRARERLITRLLGSDKQFKAGREAALAETQKKIRDLEQALPILTELVKETAPPPEAEKAPEASG